jgi:endonuclease/exonuclease/phosphatase family metal-dependent hydrolase
MTDLTERSTRSRASLTVLAALVFVVGMELARFQFGSLGWYQRDTIGIGALDLLPLALAPFLASVLVPLSSRLLSLATSLRAAIVVLVAARLVTQFAEDPAVDHWASAVGVAAFVGLLALLAGTARTVLVGGILLGITLDSALKAVGSSLDLVYRDGWAPGLAAVVLAAAIVYLGFTTEVERRAGPGWLTGLTMVGLGPFLFVQYLVLQSAGWTAELTGTGAGLTSLRIVLLNVAAVWLAHRFGSSPLIGAVCAIVVGAAVVAAEGSSLTFNLLALVAVPAAGPLWALMVPDFERPSVAPAATWVTTGMVLFLLLGFAYYLPLDLDLGFSQAQARITGAVLVGLVGLASALRRAPAGEAVPTGMPALAAVALILPLAGLLPGPDLPDAPDGPTIRVMAYNLHQAFGTSGEMDVDAVADVILESGATIVGMQEVARGGLLNAGTDLLVLLGERLGWEHSVFFGTTDPVWGNAILSRYPLSEVERRLLPLVGTPYRRGYLGATVDAPGGSLLFISTHLQHINDPDLHDVDPEADLYPVHHEQLGVVIEQWAAREPAVLVGDLNARPGWRQVEELLEAGWVDAWASAGEGDGFTANAADPRYRIDYVFHTPDLTTERVEVIESQASDHFAVVADLSR